MKEFQRLTLLSTLILVLGLLAVGVAYGAWTETLIVKGTVSTGEVNVDWGRGGLSEFYCSDSEQQNLASIVSTYADDNTIQMTVSNAYPGYIGHCQGKSVVKGTIPVLIKSIDFIPGSNLTGCTTVYDHGTGSFTATCDQMEIVWTNGLCKEFNVGSGEGSNLDFMVFSDAAEETSYQFNITYTYEQATGNKSCTYHP